MSKENDVTDKRNFWVVSPNVDGRDRGIEGWKQAIIRYNAAFMGWPPKKKRIGYKFAHAIKSGDIILIARRHAYKPEVVGFGIVRGELKTRLRGFKPPGGKKLGAMWKLSPFIPKEHLPRSLDVMSVLGQTAALRHIRRSTHGKICN